MAQEFNLILVDADANTEEFQYHLPNNLDHDGNPIPQREWVTGTDRQPMSVKGQMPTVVHGFEKVGSTAGYTLAIFNWFMPPVRLGKRFRKVELEIAFLAHGKRGDAELEAEMRRSSIRNTRVANSWWNPVVKKVVPSGTSWYDETSHHVDDEKFFQFDLQAGYAPYVSIGPKFSWKRNTSDDYTDSVKVTGQAENVDSAGADSNAVRWTILENESSRSGVPAFLRTAVLLKRRDRDNGQFIGRVKVKYSISAVSDFKEMVMNAVGAHHDKAVIFDLGYQTSSPTYESLSPSFGSAETAAVMEKEFQLISFQPAGSKPDESKKAKDDDTSTGTATVQQSLAAELQLQVG